MYPSDKSRYAGGSRMRSTALPPDVPLNKLWITKRDSRARISWWLTVAFTIVGLCAGALRIYFGYMGIPMIEQNLCLVLEDNFDNGQLDTSIWSHEVDLGGFG